VNRAIAITTTGWLETPHAHPDLEEVKFWKPSAIHAFSAPKFSPLLARQRAPMNAIS